ncbi:MAG TPA: chaperone ClpB, partial [Ruminococcus sp.]|nr:chaperone ClpB [Ruminococcus sp.]
MLCSRCKKRPAVVFITAMQGEKKKNDGLCLVCAKELHVPQIDEYMKQMGITDEELEQISNQMMDMMDGESFEMGGSGVMPQFLQSFMKDPGKIFGNLKDDGEESNELQTADGDEEIPSADYTEIPSGSRRERRSKRKKELRFLGNYCTNLTRRAAEGKLDAIIGRDKEIARVIQILSRRTKNNPCLIGEPGVGKTAIAEGIALRIHSGNVPMHLKDKQVYLLDLTSLVAGTQFRGQFESRVKGLLAEVKQEGNIILFIDEVHNLVGAGNSEGAMNAANILKPALSRGEVQVIGATTFEEYRKYIEKDSALERRFQPVTVNEPTVDETIEVLDGIAKYYESYHRVHISPEMIRLCAVLSERYITDRFLPDKAIDLLDESCACTNLRSPEIEAYDKLAKKKEELEAKEKSIEDETEINFEELAQVKGELIRLNTSLEEAQKKLDEVQVTADDLSKVIELWTGIPAHKIAETEFTKLAHLEDRLKAHIIGQDEAVESLAKAIKRTRVQLSPRRRPASFIFVGPTGVGKTELVKVLSQELFDSNDPLIRLDMTEFMEKHSVARMIGSPPGYVGYDEAGQLTEKVRRRPYSVILFDEIEKA